MPYGSKATGILPILSKIALRGNFPLVFDHFISKITDCTQPPENPDCFSQPIMKLAKLEWVREKAGGIGDAEDQ